MPGVYPQTRRRSANALVETVLALPLLIMLNGSPAKISYVK